MGLGEKVERFEVDYSELEVMVKEVYGINYEYPCDMECNNDTSQTFNIDGKIDDYHRMNIKEWLESNGTKGNYMGRELLNDLCANGYIEPGKYLVKVSW